MNIEILHPLQYWAWRQSLEQAKCIKLRGSRGMPHFIWVSIRDPIQVGQELAKNIWFPSLIDNAFINNIGSKEILENIKFYLSFKTITNINKNIKENSNEEMWLYIQEDGKVCLYTNAGNLITNVTDWSQFEGPELI